MIDHPPIPFHKPNKKVRGKKMMCTCTTPFLKPKHPLILLFEEVFSNALVLPFDFAMLLIKL